MSHLPSAWIQPIFRGAVLFACFAALPLMMLNTLRDYQAYREFIETGVTTEAKILDTSQKCSESTCLHYVTYQYQVNEKTYTRRKDLLASNELYDTYTENGTAQAYYLPEAPRRSILVDDFSYEESLAVRTLALSLGWGVILGLVWYPSRKMSRLREKVMFHGSYTAMYVLVVLAVIGFRISQLEGQEVPIYLPIAAIFAILVLVNLLRMNGGFSLAYPLYVVVFAGGCVAAASVLSENAATLYAVGACAVALLIDFEPSEMASLLDSQNPLL